MKYCTTILISEHIRLDLFTAEMFRVRVSALPGEKFPEKYEIPFAVGRTSPWEAVEYRADGETDSTMVAVRTEKFVVYVRKDTGTFMVETLQGRRLHPEAAPRYGMFKNHCILFDAASFWKEESSCSRYSHWFYRRETGRYDILLKEDALLDTYFIRAETYQKGYALLNELVGAEPMLPKKGYGYYQTQHLGAKGSQPLLMQTAALLRERDIPCDTLILDYEWGDGANGGEEVPWGSRLDWSDAYCWPKSPADMIAELHEMHFDVMTIRHSIPSYEGRMDEDWVCAEYAALYESEGTDGKTTVFIGDSFFNGTNFWTNFNEIYAGKDAQIAGISSTTTYDWEQIMLDRVFLHNMNPKNIVMDIGTNNFYDDGDSTDTAIESVQRMFTLMHDKMPETHIWYFSVAQRTNTSYRQNVSDLNDAMQAWCADKDWITFIDVEDLMTAEYIRPADGVHPTLDAYVDVYAAQLEKAGCVIEDK